MIDASFLSTGASWTSCEVLDMVGLRSRKEQVLDEGLELDLKAVEVRHPLFELTDEVGDPLVVERFGVGHYLVQTRLAHLRRGDDRGPGLRVLELFEEH